MSKPLSVYPKYHDFNTIALDDVVQRIIPTSNRGRKKGSFPKCLFQLLADAEEHSFTDVVNWRPHGRAFQIIDRNRFIKELHPKYFNGQSKYPSFQRQLNQYGFLRMTKAGTDQRSYYHEMFLRGREDLLSLIPRKRHSKSIVRLSVDATSEPDLSAYAPSFPRKYDSEEKSTEPTTLPPQKSTGSPSITPPAVCPRSEISRKPPRLLADSMSWPSMDFLLQTRPPDHPLPSAPAATTAASVSHEVTTTSQLIVSNKAKEAPTLGGPMFPNLAATDEAEPSAMAKSTCWAHLDKDKHSSAYLLASTKPAIAALVTTRLSAPTGCSLDLGVISTCHESNMNDNVNPTANADNAETFDKLLQSVAPPDSHVSCHQKASQNHLATTTDHSVSLQEMQQAALQLACSPLAPPIASTVAFGHDYSRIGEDFYLIEDANMDEKSKSTLSSTGGTSPIIMQQQQQLEEATASTMQLPQDDRLADQRFQHYRRSSLMETDFEFLSSSSSVDMEFFVNNME